MKIVLLYSLMLISMCNGQAQDTLHRKPRPRVILKITPLTLINSDPTIQGAVEIRTGKRQSIQVEFGYCRPSWGQQNIDTNFFGQREYWRARMEYRFYLNRVRTYFINGKTTPISNAAPFGNYLTLDVYFKQINAVDQRTVVRNFQSGLNTYSEKLHAPVTRFIGAVYVKYGYQRPFLHTNGSPSRFLLDASAGLGLRRIQVERHGIDLPTDYYYHAADGIAGNRFDEAFIMIIPDITVNVKIGYALWRKKPSK